MNRVAGEDGEGLEELADELESELAMSGPGNGNEPDV
jgi:hypothetical protein